MTVIVKRVSNGWHVELWLSRTEREEHVFLDNDALMEFLNEAIARHA